MGGEREGREKRDRESERARVSFTTKGKYLDDWVGDCSDDSWFIAIQYSA